MHFETADMKLVVGLSTSFKLKVAVTCTARRCNLPTAAENIVLTIASSPGLAGDSALAHVGSGWARQKGQDIFPDVGKSFLMQGHTRMFVISGFLRVNIVM